MKMVLAEDIVSVTDFARGTKQHLAELVKHNRPRVLTQNGKAAAVVLSVETYEAMAHQAEEHRLDRELKVALEAYASGDRGRPLGEALGDLRRKLFKPQRAK